MVQRTTGMPDQVRKFAPPKGRDPRPESGNPTDEAGAALIAMLQQAATLSNDNCDRALAYSQKLSGQLGAAEDRIAALETELDQAAVRAQRNVEAAARAADERIGELQAELERAQRSADERARETRAAEARIGELKDELGRVHERASRAEGWLELIRSEIEQKLIAPLAAARAERPPLH